jgi:hypothetical protein
MLSVAKVYSFNVSRFYFHFLVSTVCFAGFEGFASIIAKDTVLGYGGCVTG